MSHNNMLALQFFFSLYVHSFYLFTLVIFYTSRVYYWTATNVQSPYTIIINLSVNLLKQIASSCCQLNN